MVGGGNSAGQAAMHLAHHARSVRMAVRGDDLSRTMSRYLVDRIERSPRIEVLTRTELRGVNGTSAMEAVRCATAPAARSRRAGGGGLRDDRRRAVHGGRDRRCWARTPPATCCAARAPRRARATCAGRSRSAPPHLLETVRPGVFAAGDVRAGAANRVAARRRRRRADRALRARRARRVATTAARARQPIRVAAVKTRATTTKPKARPRPSSARSAKPSGSAMAHASTARRAERGSWSRRATATPAAQPSRNGAATCSVPPTALPSSCVRRPSAANSTMRAASRTKASQARRTPAP